MTKIQIASIPSSLLVLLYLLVVTNPKITTADAKRVAHAKMTTTRIKGRPKYDDDQRMTKEEIGKQYLYAGDDSVGPVTEYIKPKQKAGESDEEFKKRWLHPDFLNEEIWDRPRIVEFYSPWCGHCISYKPQYIELAKEATQIHQMPYLEFYAISCSAHAQICQNESVHAYPAVKYYSPKRSKGKKTNNGKDGADENKSGPKTVNKIGLTAQKLFEEYISKDGFRQVGGGDKSNSDRVVNTKTQAETKVKTKVDAGPTYVEKIGNMSFVRSGEAPKSEKGTELHHDDEKRHDDKGLTTTTSSKAMSVIVTTEDIYHDASISFHYALKNSIYMSHGKLSESKVHALKSWLHLLDYTLPDTMRDVRDTVQALLKNFERIIKGEEYLNEVLKSNKKYKSKSFSNEWTVACSHNEPYLGYTCGLWELFHIMSIGLVESTKKIPGNEMYDEKTKKPFSTMLAGQILRDYIDNFFACEECRQHFISSYDACEFDRCNRLTYDAIVSKEGKIEGNLDQFPLWLWEFHNDVNMRLFREDIARKGLKEPSVQQQMVKRWPGKRVCDTCWNEDETWNENEVYPFLKHNYWSQSTTRSEHMLVDNAQPWVPGQDMILYLSFVALFAVFLISKWKKKRAAGRHKKADDKECDF